MLQTLNVAGRMSSGSAHYGSKAMAAKESYCYRILKTHSVIVDFDGEPHLTNVPGVVEGETFKQWKEEFLAQMLLTSWFIIQIHQRLKPECIT